MSDHEEQGLVRQGTGDDGGLPAPRFSGAQMAKSLQQYKELQATLDQAMPEALMEIQGRQFRKKMYWRAVNVAFQLSVEFVSEERVVAGLFGDNKENFGYNVVYRATAPNGRSVTGDGAAYAVEKAGRFKCPHPHPTRHGKSACWPPESCPKFDPEFAWRALPPNATEHNVRSHAHTRAYNRAVSNLVGFGEVSAEEVDINAVGQEPAPVVEAETVQQAPPPGHPAAGEPPPDIMENELPNPAYQGPAGSKPGRGAVPPIPPQGPAGPRAVPPQAGGARGASNRPAPPAARPPQQAAARPPQAQNPPQPTGGAVISDAQDRRFFALAMQAGWDSKDLNPALQEVWGYNRSDEILKKDYNRICAWVQNGPPRD